jgi:hypothetical protein
MMNRIFKIAIRKTNGLPKYSQEIKTFIISQNINILLVPETHFANMSYSSIYEYTLHCIIHFDGKVHGGTALL